VRWIMMNDRVIVDNKLKVLGYFGTVAGSRRSSG
jgi:hypothetical protein